MHRPRVKDVLQDRKERHAAQVKKLVVGFCSNGMELGELNVY